MLRRRALAIASCGLALVLPAPASAHGPCRCTWPVVAKPGAKLRTATAYKIVFNPAPGDFRDQTTPVALASGFRRDVPSTVVLQLPRSQPMRRGTFRVPARTPPGIYFVLIYDGSEGGAHTTWDYVQVPGEPARGEVSPVPREPPDSGPSPATVAIALGAGVAIALAAVARARRRRARA